MRAAVPSGVALDTPWLRDELREHLARLADERWLEAETAASDGTSPELDEILDFLDETDVGDDPGSRIGYILRDEPDAAVIAKLGIRDARVARRTAASGSARCERTQAPRRRNAMAQRAGEFMFIVVRLLVAPLLAIPARAFLVSLIAHCDTRCPAASNGPGRR